MILARELVARGIRVAHIVYPLGEAPASGVAPTLIERRPYRGAERVFGPLIEARSIWRAMGAADAATYVFRTGRSQLFLAALFCLLHRRRLVYSGANDFDFDVDSGGGLHRALYRAALRRTYAIVAQTPQQQELARQAAPRHPRIATIPSFVEPAPERSASPDGFVWIGRLTSYKRPLEYAELAASLPDIRFRAVFFEETTSPPGMAKALQQRARENPNLELLGKLPRREVLGVIERSYAVVSTSSSEGMPNVFLEAWARGVPVASLECDPGARLSTHGLGLLAGGSRERLVEITRSLAEDESLRDELGRRGRTFVQREHDPGAVARQWLAVIQGGVG